MKSFESSDGQSQIKNEKVSGSGENKLAKEAAWESKRKEIEGYADALGYGIDGKIKESLVALNILGLPTSASCEGHIDRGISAPWVEISAPNEPEERFVGEKETYQKIAEKYGITSEDVKRSNNHQAWVEAEIETSKNDETERYKKWQGENEKLMVKAEGLIQEFYKNRKASEGDRIVIDKYGAGIFRIHNGGEDYKNVPENISEEQRRELSRRLSNHQKEMEKFSMFLKEKYLNNHENKNLSEGLSRKIFEALDNNSSDIENFQVNATIPVKEGVYNWHDNFLKLMEPKLKGEKILDLFCGPNSIKKYFNKDSKTEVVGVDVVDSRADIKADVKNIKKFIKPEKQFNAIFELGGVPENINYELIKDYLDDGGLYITGSSDEVFYKDIKPALENSGKQSESFFGRDVYQEIKHFQPKAIVEVKNIKSYIPDDLKNEVYIIWKKRV